MPKPRPPEAAEWSAVSHYKLIREGFTYRRRAYSYIRRYVVRSWLQKLKGRRRRVRRFLYRDIRIDVPPTTIHIPPHYEWIVEFPPVVPPPDEWLTVSEYLDRKREELASDPDMPGELEIEDPIYRREEGGDLINLKELVVWERPDMEEVRLIARKRLIGVVRAWALLYNEKTERYFIFARARSVALDLEARPRNYEQLKAFVYDELYDSIVESVDSFDYIQVRGVIAWTFWYGGEFAPSMYKYHEGKREWLKKQMRPRKRTPKRRPRR